MAVQQLTYSQWLEVFKGTDSAASREDYKTFAAGQGYAPVFTDTGQGTGSQLGGTETTPQVGSGDPAPELTPEELIREAWQEQGYWTQFPEMLKRAGYLGSQGYARNPFEEYLQKQGEREWIHNTLGFMGGAGGGEAPPPFLDRKFGQGRMTQADMQKSIRAFGQQQGSELGQSLWEGLSPTAQTGGEPSQYSYALEAGRDKLPAWARRRFAGQGQDLFKRYQGQALPQGAQAPKWGTWLADFFGY